MPGWDSGKAVGDISGRKPNPVPEVSILRGWALADFGYRQERRDWYGRHDR